VQFKRKLYHDVLYTILRSVVEAQTAGGFTFMHRGKPRTLYPLLCLFVVDTPERQLQQRRYNSARAEASCHRCEARCREFPNTALGMEAPLRTAAGVERDLQEARSDGNATQVKAALRQISSARLCVCACACVWCLRSCLTLVLVCSARCPLWVRGGENRTPRWHLPLRRGGSDAHGAPGCG
jgi:hypothetical protein